MAISKIVTNSVDVGAVALTTQVTGTLPVANGGTGVTTSTGSGANVLGTSPTLVTPALGTPASGVLTNCTGVAKAALPAGCVLQVVSATKTDTFSTASASYIDVTGWTASITPINTSSKILVIASGAVSNSADNSFNYVKLVRDTTSIYLGDARGSATRASADASLGNFVGAASRSMPVFIHFLDSPNSASAVTYKLQIITTNGGTAIVGGTSTTSDANRANVPTTITLMEIAG